MRLSFGLWIALLALCLLPQKSDGQTKIPVTDSHFFFSPYNWTIPGSNASPAPSPAEIVTIQPGAYFILQFSNSTQVALNLDLLGTSPGGGVTSLIIQYSIDNTLYPKLTLNNVYPNLTLATGLAAGPHTLQVWFVSSAYSQNRWNRTAALANGQTAPPQSLRITGVTLDASATLQAPTGLRSKRILFYGDSITEGVNVLGASVNDSTQTFAITCARLLNAEYGVVGNAGQGWIHNTAPSTGVPLFPAAYTFQFDQALRFTTGVAVPPPDYVVVNMGTNDHVYGSPPNDPGVTAAVFNWLVQMRTAFPSSQVFLMVPFGGFVEPALQSAYSEYLLAHPADTRVHFINLGTTAQTGLTALGKGATPESVDGEHPNAATHLLLGYQLTAAIQTALGRNDFNADSKSDLVLQNTSTHQIAGWFLNDSKVVNSAVVSDTPDSNYQVVGSADFNGDGKPDLLFQNSQTGQLAVWFMNGMTMVGGAALTTLPAAGYHVVGTADFNRDGQNDLLFQNAATGALVIWYMNGLQYLGGEFVSATPAAGYHVEAIADFDVDGRPDVVLRNASGNIALWHLDNATVFAAETLSLRLDTAYRIAGPR